MKKLTITVFSKDFEDLKNTLEGVSQQLDMETPNDILEYQDRSGYAFEVRDAQSQENVYSV